MDRAQWLRRRIVQRVDEVISILQYLPESERGCGWGEELSANWIAAFRRLRDVVASEKALPAEYRNFISIRGLDMDGIGAGKVHEACEAIDSDMLELADIDATK